MSPVSAWFKIYLLTFSIVKNSYLVRTLDGFQGDNVLPFMCVLRTWTLLSGREEPLRESVIKYNNFRF